MDEYKSSCLSRFLHSQRKPSQSQLFVKLQGPKPQHTNNMGRRPAEMNPALIEPDYEVSQSKTKKPRLTQSESTAMAALLSFRSGIEQRTVESNVEPNTKLHTVALKTGKKLDGHASDLSNVTDDEESVCSRGSQTLPPSTGKPNVVFGGSPPPLRMALVKPMLPSFKMQRKIPAKLPQGRPLRAAPGLAKHLVKQTKPICLKLSP